MHIRFFETGELEAVRQLFIDVFSASANREEGETIGGLVNDLVAQTGPDDLYGFVAVEQGDILGAIFLSRMAFASGISAFVLAPVAVTTRHHGKGVGQALINHGLDHLRKRGVALVCVYGDPNYYSQVGFKPASELGVEAPFVLSMPFGWQCQALTEDRELAATGKPTCVAALSHAHYW